MKLQGAASKDTAEGSEEKPACSLLPTPADKDIYSKSFVPAEGKIKGQNKEVVPVVSTKTGTPGATTTGIPGKTPAPIKGARKGRVFHYHRWGGLGLVGFSVLKTPGKRQQKSRILSKTAGGHFLTFHFTCPCNRLRLSTVSFLCSFSFFCFGFNYLGSCGHSRDPLYTETVNKNNKRSVVVFICIPFQMNSQKRHPFSLYSFILNCLCAYICHGHIHLLFDLFT